MSRPADPSPDAPLRANVRLLGEILGRVLTEQEGEELFRLEERVRLLARLGRRGDTGASRALAETIEALDVETQAVVLRAFTVYFHLANIAEQHHRVRRRREHEREGGDPRESLAEALALLAREGIADDEVESAAGRVSVELVLTAHPTEALPRTILEKHRRFAQLLDGLDDPRLTPAERAEREVALAEEVTILWQTDEVRSHRPRVVDEIRQALWFLEDSLWDAAAHLQAVWREHLPGNPLRFGTWIGGDLDGNPNAGAETVREAVERGSALVRGAAAARRPCARSVLGHVEHAGGGRRRVAAVGLLAATQPDRAVPTAADGDLGAARRGRLPLGRRAAGRARPDRGEPSRHGGSRIADGGLAALRRHLDVFGLTGPALDLRVHARQLRHDPEGTPGGARGGGGAPAAARPEAIDTLIVSMTRSAEDVVLAESLAEQAGLDVTVVPLLETIDDLRGAESLAGGAPRTAAELGRLELMVGYSDSARTAES